MSEQFSTIAKSANIGKDLVIEHPIQVGPRAEIHGGKVGKYLFVNIETVIYGNVEIGRYCTFARRCQIGGVEHPFHYLSSSFFRISQHWFPDDPVSQSAPRIKNSLAPGRKRSQKTSIGNDVWFGAGAIVLRGVNIADGAVIAAGSVVTKDVPPYAIVGGNPAKIIKYRFDDVIIEKLLKLRWWDLPMEKVAELPLNDIDTCINMMLGWANN